MTFADEDKVIIKQHNVDKEYGVKRLLNGFPNKNTSMGGQTSKVLRTSVPRNVKHTLK